MKEKKEKAVKEKPVRKKRTEKESAAAEQTNNGAVNYNVYHMSKGEKLLYILLAGALLYGLGYIFYQNVIISLLFSLLALKYPAIRTKAIIRKRKRQLTMQFKDMLYSLSSAVSAGNSVERALVIARDDMVSQYGESNVFIVQELELMVSRISINLNIEDVFADFAERSGLEDIRTFADIFEVAKRTGGNLVQIIRQTTDVIADKIEVETEIDTALSGKKMEQKVVTVMPIALTLFMTVSTDGFMDPIFNTLSGRLVATVALAMILAGALWSNSITNIEI
ncbi:MAG: type II secretion system F family protein [Acetatifactor sp.]|nr:type II secretion system F family protein [Acetatifactor sp.]